MSCTMINPLPSFALHRRLLVFGGCIALLLLTSGCGNGQKEVYPVEGQVLDAEDKPAAGALVIFHPVKADDQDLNKPRGYVDDNGRFSLTTYEKDDGAPEGDYIVTIEWCARKTSPFDKEGKDQLAG